MKTMSDSDSLHARKFSKAAQEVAKKRGDGMFTFGEVRALMYGESKDDEPNNEGETQ